jgi:cell division GTPase FtsZ
MKSEKIEDYLYEKIGSLPYYDKAVKSIKAMVEKAGKVNLDFDDVKYVLDNAKEIRFFSGTENDITKISYSEADGALVSIEGPETMSLNEARNIVKKIAEKINEEARIVWGAKINNKLKKIKFFVILVQKMTIIEELIKNQKAVRLLTVLCIINEYKRRGKSKKEALEEIESLMRAGKIYTVPRSVCIMERKEVN